MVQIGHQHRRRLEVHHAIAACLDLLEGRRVDGDGRLRRCLSTLHVAVEGDPTVLGMDRPIMSEEQVSADKCTPALQAFERAFLGV